MRICDRLCYVYRWSSLQQLGKRQTELTSNSILHYGEVTLIIPVYVKVTNTKQLTRAWQSIYIGWTSSAVASLNCHRKNSILSTTPQTSPSLPSPPPATAAAAVNWKRWQISFNLSTRKCITFDRVPALVSLNRQSIATIIWTTKSPTLSLWANCRSSSF